MPHVVAYITGHGFGHATRMAYARILEAIREAHGRVDLFRTLTLNGLRYEDVVAHADAVILGARLS